MPGTKPVIKQLRGDFPAEGPAVVFTVTLTLPTGESKTAYSCALLGPGRDYLTREDALANRINTDAVQTEVSKQYESMVELVADFPEAHLDGTAKRMLVRESALEEQRLAVEQWEADMAAAGLEPCERCGGAGGWKGWPGYTCYGCGGSGHEGH